MDTNYFGATDMSVTTFQGFSILVVSCATGHKSTSIHMSPPALEGRRSPSNWHLSVTQVAHHRLVHNNGWWAVRHKQRGDRRGCLKDKEEKGEWVGLEVGGGWGLAKEGETSEACYRRREMRALRLCCFVFLARHRSFWFVSMCLWCCCPVCFCLSLLLDCQILLRLFSTLLAHCSCFAPTCAECKTLPSTSLTPIGYVP